MSASPQANQGLDDGPPVPPAQVPSHTALADNSEDDDAAMAGPASLSHIGRHADENDVKDEEGEASDDQPEDAGEDPQPDLDPELHPKQDSVAPSGDPAPEATGVNPLAAVAEDEPEQDDDDDEDDKDAVRAERNGEADDDDEEEEEEVRPSFNCSHSRPQGS